MRLAASQKAIFAYGGGDQVWTSLEGPPWTSLSPLTTSQLKVDHEWFSKPSSSFNRVRVIGFRQGLIAVAGGSRFSGTNLLFSGELPFDYLDQGKSTAGLGSKVCPSLCLN